MSETRDLRRVPDRRRVPRGGRRPGDLGGFAPLIVVIDGDPARREACAIALLQSRFAVAPFSSADRALAVIQSLSPDAIVVASVELDAVTAAALAAGGKRIPIVPSDTRREFILNALRLSFRSTSSEKSG